MQIQPLHIENDEQIGGGSRWVADRVADAMLDAHAAMQAAAKDWGSMPAVGPHPREAALAAAREAVLHLNEALSVEAPADALIDTRHALEELTGTIIVLEKLGNERPVAPGIIPLDRFQQAIDLLNEAEHKLLGPPVLA